MRERQRRQRRLTLILFTIPPSTEATVPKKTVATLTVVSRYGSRGHVPKAVLARAEALQKGKSFVLIGDGLR
jgi:hypothetical protein